ncbi:MAG: cytochrome c1 [Aquificae bacterium]|nr:cytochrome c1 [Aquificota bacterium]
MNAWGIIKTIIIGGSTLVFFFLLWFYNPFKHVEHYEVDEEVKQIIANPWKKTESGKTIAEEGRELFINFCSSCHSLRYDGIYLMSIQTNPKWKKIEKSAGRPVYRHGILYKDRFFVPKDVYEAFAHDELQQLKASLGQVPPDVSTLYLARGEGYLYQFILYPGKVLPGTSMPPMFNPQADPQAKEKVAKIVAYMKSVNTPPPKEQMKRNIMGILIIVYFIVAGLLLWKYRENLLKRLGYH